MSTRLVVARHSEPLECLASESARLSGQTTGASAHGGPLQRAKRRATRAAARAAEWRHPHEGFAHVRAPRLCGGGPLLLWGVARVAALLIGVALAAFAFREHKRAFNAQARGALAGGGLGL